MRPSSATELLTKSAPGSAIIQRLALESEIVGFLAGTEEDLGMLAQMFVKGRRAGTGSPDHDELWDARHLLQTPPSAPLQL